MSSVLLVTGGSRGIGAAVARLAGAEGWDVAVNYARDAEAAARVVADIERNGRRAVAIQGDVAKEAEVVRLFAEAERRLGPITGLVNNAGTTGRASRLDAVSTATLEAVFDLNILGAFLCAREAVKRMSRAHGGKGGAIVNISSGAATLGGPGEWVWYAASKGAIDSMTIGLAREVAGEGIRVNSVQPGLIDTELHASSGIENRVAKLAPSVPLGRAGEAEEVAEAVLFLLSDAASYITAAILRVGGGR
ncbi:MAG TPA: SDR family oxidoreductase [Stellaceae bacterium]|nr:SDR family oxidoreductase [Stellaceae bacterium]